MKHTSSLALFHEACALMPGGVNSPVRSFSSAHADCLFADHAYGSHIVDVDGNTYLDYIGYWGPMILDMPIRCLAGIWRRLFKRASASAFAQRRRWSLPG